MEDDWDYDDEYDLDGSCFQFAPPPEPVSKWFSCLSCKGGLMTTLMPNMITGVGCPCGQAFMFGAEEHIHYGPAGIETTAPSDAPKPRENHVRDAVRANM